MTERHLQRQADILKTLGQPTRLKILELLKDGERCVCEIYPALGQEQANISKHLNMMRRVGIVGCRKEGQRVVYWIRDNGVLEILARITAILAHDAEEDHRAFRAQ